METSILRLILVFLRVLFGNGASLAGVPDQGSFGSQRPRTHNVASHRPRMPLSAWTAIRREVESTGCPWAMKEIRYFQPSRTSELFWATGPVGVGSFPPVSCPIDLGHQG